MKLKGQKLVIEIQPDSTGAFIDVGGESRTFSYNRTGDEIDVTVRSDTAKDYLAGFPDISAEMGGITLGGAPTPALDELVQGAVGTIKWYPEGKVDTLPMYTSTYTVTEDGQEYPYDDAVSWTVSMRLTSAIVVAAYDAP
jgi:hypothetical protein